MTTTSRHIDIRWTDEDVELVAQNNFPNPLPLNKTQIDWVLNQLQDSYDPNNGITWENVEHWVLEAYQKQQNIEACLNHIWTDLLMLQAGTWIPDKHTTQSTINNVDQLAEELGIELTQLKE